MKDIWDYLKGLFRQASESSAANPYLHEVIHRSEADMQAFRAWQGSLRHRRILDWLHDQYAVWQVLPDDVDPAVDFLHTPSSKGFAIHLHRTDYSRQELTFLLDHFRDRVCSLDYKVQLSDTRSWTNTDRVETVERHYLKPRPAWSENRRFDQKFGNITLELVLHDEKPQLFKCRANCYNDRLYSDAQAFPQLMQALLTG
ncbi:MAG: hypothetical protein RLY31_1847 [Bacteroidota bacterium]|jgi:hypothetical protein